MSSDRSELALPDPQVQVRILSGPTLVKTRAIVLILALVEGRSSPIGGRHGGECPYINCDWTSKPAAMTEVSAFVAYPTHPIATSINRYYKQLP
jgi:hypothetical protein